MRFILFLIIMALPIAEIWALIVLGQAYGWGLMVYLAVMAYLGLQLIRQEKATFSARMMHNLTQGGHPIKAMFGSARTIIAGVLLMFPGVVTDAIAAVLLLMPSQKVPPNVDNTFDNAGTTQSSQHRRAANDDVIEGEFKREDD